MGLKKYKYALKLSKDLESLLGLAFTASEKSDTIQLRFPSCWNLRDNLRSVYNISKSIKCEGATVVITDSLMYEKLDLTTKVDTYFLERKAPLVIQVCDFDKLDKEYVNETSEKINEKISDLCERIEKSKENADVLAENEKTEIKKMKPKCVVGIGGGKIIDLAKMVADKERVYMISVPTQFSHDGVMSGTASIFDDGKKTSVTVDPPFAVICDNKTISEAPLKSTRAGWEDFISNYSSALDWSLAHEKDPKTMFSRKLYRLLLISSKIATYKAADGQLPIEKSIDALAWAIFISSVATNSIGTSQPISGSEHKISHKIDELFGNREKKAMHGEQVGLAALYTTYLHNKYRSADLDSKTYRRALIKIGAPITAKEIGLDDEQFMTAVCEAIDSRPERYTILNYVFDNKPVEQRKKRIKKDLCLLGIINE